MIIESLWAKSNDALVLDIANLRAIRIIRLIKSLIRYVVTKKFINRLKIQT